MSSKGQHEIIPKSPVVKNPTEPSWIRYIKQRIDNNKNMLLFISGATGCQPAGSKVMMANGSWRNIEDVKVGDLVLSPQEDGNHTFSKVVNTTQWNSEENYFICEKNKQRKTLYTCSSNHDIPVWFNSSKRDKQLQGIDKRIRKWVIKHYTAKELTSFAHDSFNHNLIAFSSNPIQQFMGRVNCFIEPYTLGYYLGDGHYSYYNSITINKNYYTMKRSDKQYFRNHTLGTLSITTADSIVMEYISKYYPIRDIRQQKNNKSKDYLFHLNGIFAEQLNSIGLANKKSGDKFVPPSALFSDIDYRKKLLAGIIDSDGYFARGMYDITTKSEQLALDIEFLVHSLGGRCSIHKVKKGIKKLGFVGEYYHVGINLGYMKLPTLLERKKGGLSCRYISPNRTSIALKPAPPSIVYGITLDSKSSWYITDNYMVTKNSGKTYTSLSIAEMADPTFTVDRVVFNGKDLMKVVATMKRGHVIVFEEVGVEMSNRNWASVTNKMLNYLFQTFRHRNFILIMNSPYMDFIDASTRKLFHAEFQTEAIDKKKQTVRVIPQVIQYNSRIQKFYFKYLRVYRPSLGLVPIRRWNIPRPSKELTTAYEIKKREFTDKLNTRIMKELDKADTKDDKVTYQYTCNTCGHVTKSASKSLIRCGECRRANLTPNFEGWLGIPNQELKNKKRRIMNVKSEMLLGGSAIHSKRGNQTPRDNDQTDSNRHETTRNDANREGVSPK